MGYYKFRQNNSGGRFNIDESLGIGPDVWIEADSPDEANEYAQTIGIYFNGVEKWMDCDCCGDRWYKVEDFDGYTRVRIDPEYDFEWHPVVYIHHKSYGKRLIERVTK